MKKIIAIVLVAFLLAGCSNNTANESTSSATSAEISSESTSSAAENSSESVSSSVSTSVEESKSSTESSSVPAESSSTTKKEEKPVSSSTSSSSTNKPVSSSSNKPVENPVSSSSTNKPTSSSTTKIEEKPIHTHTFTEATCTNPATCISCGETKGTTINHNYNNGSCIYCGKNDPNYVAPCKCDKHNIDDPNHDWEITYTTTEPKWCEEMHFVTDYGYDMTLASKFLGVDYDKALRIFEANMEAIGVNGASGNASMTIKVWGTETFETRKCKNCGLSVGAGNIGKITPMGEWQFLNGKNPRITDSRFDFNTIFYDPYNVPQKVIDNIILMDKLAWESFY